MLVAAEARECHSELRLGAPCHWDLFSSKSAHGDPVSQPLGHRPRGGGGAERRARTKLGRFRPNLGCLRPNPGCFDHARMSSDHLGTVVWCAGGTDFRPKPRSWLSPPPAQTRPEPCQICPTPGHTLYLVEARPVLAEHAALWPRLPQFGGNRPKCGRNRATAFDGRTAQVRSIVRVGSSIVRA